MNTWDWPESGKNDFLAEKLNKYLAVSKYCGSEKGCFNYGWKVNGNAFTFFKTLNGEIGTYGSWTEANRSGKTILKNNMRYSFSVEYPTGYNVHCNGTVSGDSNKCGLVGEITVDINGQNGPNRSGYDVFSFMYYINGDVRPWNKKKGEANSNQKYGAESCSISTNTGTGCAYWVIKHNNMDYKYRNVTDDEW